MSDWLKETIEKAKKKHGSVELKTINGRHYLYKVTSVYDPEKKRARKVSGEYLGRVTPQGLIEPRKRDRTIHEYANSKLLTDIIGEVTPSLMECFPDEWRELTALSITRTIRNVPIKYVKDAWEKLHASTVIEAHLSPNTVAERLRAVGADLEAQRRFFLGLMGGSGVYYYDLSSIFSRSANLNLAEKGYNGDHIYLDQVNFALLFSREAGTPVMLKSMPGSIRDVKTLRSVLEEYPLSSCILVLDRGFASADSVEEMARLGVGFVQPLRRNSSLIDYGVAPSRLFVYRDRGIKYAETRPGGVGEGVRLILYEDVLMRGEEHSNLIRLRVGRRGDVEIDERRLGKVAILTNLDLEGEEVYGLYKGREEVEQAFDALKNELENDKMYLGDDDAVRGYFFVSFLSLYLYFRVLGLVRGAGLSDRLGVGELLFQLSKVYAIGGGGRMRLSEVPSKVGRLMEELGLDILPKS